VIIIIIGGLHYSYSVLYPLQSGKVTSYILHRPTVLECCIWSLACSNI